MPKKKTDTVKWRCPDCGKEWVSSIKKIWFGRCYACGGSFSFNNKTRKDLKWKFVKDEVYERQDYGEKV